MRYFQLAFLFCLPILVQAQNHTPRCHFDSVYTEQLKSVDFQKIVQQNEEAFQRFKNQKSRAANSTYTIPVVVHVVKNESQTDMVITDEEIYRQIEILNESYNATNNDIIQTPDYFNSEIGNPSIEFCLATVDPQGYASIGITRNSTEVSSFSTALDNVKHTAEGGVDAWDTNSYLNIWVAKITTSVLGYSHAPSKNISSNEHGLVISYKYFGVNDHPKYGMGKTAVHEIGHYLNLNHPWGVGSGSCELDDGVDDTPVSEKAYYEIPEHPQVSCETVDMFMNYMEYVNDSVMVMFSKGQVERMHFALNYYSNRKSLLQSNGCGIPDLIAEPQVKHTSSELIDDGAIYLNIASGIPPYSIAWDTGSNIDSLTNLSTGDYSVTILDSLERELNLSFNISYYGNLYDSDDFESYQTDSLLYLQSNSWKAYCADSFAANIHTQNAPEGSQFLEINGSDGSNQFSRNLGSLVENAFDLSFQLYVPSGRSAAYTVYHDADCSDPESAYQLQFHTNGQGYIKVGEENISFDFPQNQWFNLVQLIDMDRDLVVLTIDDQEQANWSIDRHNIPTRLSSIVFNDEVDSLTQVHYYIDDFKFELAVNTDVGIYEDTPDLKLLLYPNPTYTEINIRLGNKLNNHYEVSVVNILGQVFMEKQWDARNHSELKFSVESLNQGVYFVFVKSKDVKKVLRFVVQR